MYSDYYKSFEEYEEDIKLNFKELCLKKYDEKYENLKEYVNRFADQKSNEIFKHFEKMLKAEIKNQIQVR